MDTEISKLTLRQLQIFVAVASHSSFGKAADQLNLTGPAVSMQMSKLSEDLKVPLFEKNGRAISITSAGNALLPYAEQVLQVLKEAESRMNDVRGKIDRRVSVAMVTTARNFGPKLLQNFKDAHPEVMVKTLIMNRKGVIKLLEDDEIHMAVMGRTPRKLEVDTLPFAKHPYVLIAHPDHPLSSKNRISGVELSSEKFFIREEGSGTRMVHDHFFLDSGLDLPQSQVMNGNEDIKQAVMANMGLAFISGHTIGLETLAGKLCVLDIADKLEDRQWFVIHKKGKSFGTSAQEFMSFVQQNGQSVIDAYLKGD